MREAIRIAVFLVVVAAAGTAVAEDARRWSITPPVGWDDMTEAFRATPEGQQMAEVVAKHGGTLELAAYMAGDVGPLLVIYSRSPSDRGKGVPVLNFEAGVRNGLKEQTTEASYNHLEDGNAIVGDGVYTSGDQRLHVRLMTGVDREDKLHGVVARCIGPDDVCSAAVKSLALDRTNLQPLMIPRRSEGGVDRSSAAYQSGRIVGMVLSGVLVVALLMSYLRRRRAANKPAGS